MSDAARPPKADRAIRRGSAASALRQEAADRAGEGCVKALRRSLSCSPTYAPAILALGTAEYQLRRHAQGRRLLFSLLALPRDTKDIVELIDKAGDFFIQASRYSEGLALYRQAAARYPRVGVFRQGIGCCAGHEGLRAEATRASRAALALEPGNQRFVNDLGWTLCEAGRLQEACAVLRKAVDMDKKDALAAENLKICLRRMTAPGKNGRRKL